MKLLVFGMMRSGTTLVCDLLTQPGQSLIFSEPMKFSPWRDQRARELHAVAQAFGLPVGSEPPKSEDYQSLAAYFEQVLEPPLRDLKVWGYKEVFFHNWRQVLNHERPDRLVLCVRDMRDVVLSALDLVINSRLAFPGGRKLRDEAWLVSRLVYDANEIMKMRAHPHHLLRYEDLVTDRDVATRLIRFAGLEQLGASALSRKLNTGGSRRRELDKHGIGISGQSAARFTKERDPVAFALANHVHRLLPDYATTFGYDQATPKRPDDRSTMTWSQVENWCSTEPRGFDPAFGRRRARAAAARYIRPGARIGDLGCLLPALKYMLPKGCRYLGLDRRAGGPDMKAADWPRGDLSGVSSATLLTVLGSLEHVKDVKGFLDALKASGKQILLTYATSDGTGGLDRSRFGWRNHLSGRDLRNAFHETGFQVIEQGNIDGVQSLFKLQSR